jgi:hypothetical protein
VRRHREVVVAHARQGPVDAVELLADVLADDAAWACSRSRSVAVGRPVRLEQGVADDRADDEQGERQAIRSTRKVEPGAGAAAGAARSPGSAPRVAEDARLERGADRVGAHGEGAGRGPRRSRNAGHESVFGSAAAK